MNSKEISLLSFLKILVLKHNQKQPPELFQKKLLLNLLKYSLKNTHFEVFFKKVAGLKSGRVLQDLSYMHSEDFVFLYVNKALKKFINFL